MGGINLSAIPAKALSSMLTDMSTAVSKQTEQPKVLEYEKKKI